MPFLMSVCPVLLPGKKTLNRLVTVATDYKARQKQLAMQDACKGF